jgi:replicative DNA helicase
VDHHRFLGGYLTKDEWARLAGAQTTLAEAEGKIHIDDTAGISTASMRRKVRRLNTRLAKRGKRVGLVVADYLQLMSSVSRNRNDSREREVAQMSSEQKGLAKEFDVPWILVSQLNRAADTRSGHRPQLSDLRESGAIEQDADVVAFVFREEYYDKTDENIGRAEVIVAKNRNGPTGTIDLAWFDSFTRFEDLWEDAGPTSHGGKGY